METNSDPEEPTPPPPPDPAPESPVEAASEAAQDIPPEEETTPTGEAPTEQDELGTLAEAASRARLSQVDEERLVTVLKEALLGGRGGVARAIEVLPKLPWIVGVRGVEQVWPELTAGFRTQLLSGLAKEETDAARRMRLSLARSLFKFDVPVALKVALGVLKDLRDKDTGGLTAKNAQIISNVFIGRGKPWLAQLPLAELKPAEIDLLVQSATIAVFSIPHPPVTQLGVLKWAQEAGRLDKLPDPALGAVIAGVSRWSTKWQNALRKEVAELPEAITAVLKEAPPVSVVEAPEGGAPTENEPAAALDDDDEDEDDLDDEDEDEDDAPKKERPSMSPALSAGRKAEKLANASRKRNARFIPRAMQVARAAVVAAAGDLISTKRSGALRPMCSRCATSWPLRRPNFARKTTTDDRAARKSSERSSKANRRQTSSRGSTCNLKPATVNSRRASRNSPSTVRMWRRAWARCRGNRSMIPPRNCARYSG